MIAKTEEERRLLGLVLPRVEALIRLMRAEGVENPADTFRVLLRLDPANPPTEVAAKYLPLLGALRSIFQYGGNGIALEVALGRAADLAGGLL